MSRFFKMAIIRIKNAIKAYKSWVKLPIRFAPSLFKNIPIFLNCLSSICSIMTAILAVFVFFNIGNISDWNEHIKSVPNSKAAVAEWKKDLSNLRVGCSRQFAENILGIPQLIEEISTDFSQYTKTTYSNSYFTLICIFEEDQALRGFLIIGNDASFNFENYRCGFTLFDYTVNETSQYCFDHGVLSTVMIMMHESNRLECNSYYFQCDYQHSRGATSPFYIGYGVCDIGAVESYSEFYTAARSMQLTESQSNAGPNTFNESKNEAIRNIPINAFLVMEDNLTDTEELLVDGLITGALGMGRDDYANLQTDYEECINFFMENLAIDFPE